MFEIWIRGALSACAVFFGYTKRPIIYQKRPLIFKKRNTMNILVADVFEIRSGIALGACAQFLFFVRKETYHPPKETHVQPIISSKRWMSIWVQGHFLQMSPIIDGFFLGTQTDPPSTKRDTCATHHMQHEMDEYMGTGSFSAKEPYNGWLFFWYAERPTIYQKRPM